MKLDLSTLHHVSGEFNPCDVGTRPDKIDANSVRPGSVWMSGHEWMKLSLEDAQASGVIKPVETIKLQNDNKKK